MYGLDILIPVIVLLGTGFFVIVLSRFIKISPIVGFLLAGIALGPHGFGLIEESETTSLLAKLGVVFLLFDIGLHFSMKSAWTLRKDLLGLAPLQMILCGILLAFAISFIFQTAPDIALLAGMALALSSTAVVMQIISDLKQNESPVGQSAKAVLIFQDVIAVFLLIFADAIGGDGHLGMEVLIALGKTILAIGAAIVLGQYILSPLMKMIIKYDDPEMFTILGLLIVIVTATATEMVGLSLTLGAFLAGMVLAETPFRVLLQTELRPFRSLLIALFFVTVGMMLDLPAIGNDIGTVLGFTILLIASKAAIITALVFIFGRPTHHALQFSFLLAQGSEFAFVILSMAAVSAGLGAALTQNLITAVAMSMLITPFLNLALYRYSLGICRGLENTISNCPKSGNKNPVINQPVFIIGMSEVGKTLARAFKAHDVPYIAVDHDRQRFLEATAAGYIVAYGQTDDLRFWNTLGVAKARAICIASPRYEVTKRLSPIIKKIYPSLKRYVAVNNSSDGVRFATLGMIPFNNSGAPPGLEIAIFILKDLGFTDESLENWIEEEQSAYLDAAGHSPILKEVSAEDKSQPASAA